MIRNVAVRRRALLRALVSVVFVQLASDSFGQSDKPAPEKAGKDTDTDKGAKGALKKATSAVLTVVVTGDSKLISQAEVKVKFPPSVGGEATLPTDQKGEATFTSA